MECKLQRIYLKVSIEAKIVYDSSNSIIRGSITDSRDKWSFLNRFKSTLIGIVKEHTYDFRDEN